MRAGLNTIHQTLTPEAATVLNHSIAEANRRNHGQTTPLHVAATLLSSPSGYLRQACIRSHPDSSHPLQCRALELCFSVALERLPTAQNNPSPGGTDPPLNNALMAALKRAQAHQRRGCPEQQQPLLAVKVELEQLIVSILDDPSVSRVMREASFSSPAVKATIEQSLNSQSNSASAAVSGPKIGFGGFRPLPQQSPVPSVSGRNLYLNPRLQQQQQQQRPGMMQGKPPSSLHSEQQREDDVKKVIDILSRPRKRNPILVGESEPEMVLKDVLRKIERKEVLYEVLKNVEVIPIGKECASARLQMPTKLKEMVGLIESRLAGGSSNGRGIILDLGDLKWLVDQPSAAVEAGPHQGVSEPGRAAVSEIGSLLLRITGEGKCGGRLWIVGTATCETYLRCKVYHPTMENEWDLEAVSMAARTPLPALFPRLGSNGILSRSVESLSPLKSYTAAASPTLTRNTSENSEPCQRLSCCTTCLEKYEQEVSKLTMEQAEKAVPQVKSEGQLLPQWLQNAKVNSNDLKGATDPSQNTDEDLVLRKITQELQRKWTATCTRLHPSFHHSVGLQRIHQTPPVMGLYNPKLLGCQPNQRKPQENRIFGDDLQLNIINSVAAGRPASEQAASPPGSPVTTDLVLGRPKIASNSALDKSCTTADCTRNLLGCITNSERQQNKFLELQTDRPVAAADVDSYKKLLKGLVEMVWWQREAAAKVAASVTNCKLGSGRRRLGGTKGDTWLLFCGPDRVGKKKMAAALCEQLRCVGPTVISLGSRRDYQESEPSFRGKMAIDRIAEAIRRNPFSVVMLQDIDEADTVMRGSIKRAMDRGRLADSHGREISLGNVTFILTATDSCEGPWNNGSVELNEEKLASLARGGWQLRLMVCTKTGKRPAANWPDQEDRASKQRKEVGSAPPPFDLNEAADTTEDDRRDGSHNSSDLTVDNEEESGHEMRLRTTISSAPIEMVDSVDDVIVFKPVDYSLIRQNIESSIASKYSLIMGDGSGGDRLLPLKIEPEAAKKILAGVWLGNTGLEAWMEKVLVPSIRQLKAGLHAASENMVVRLELDEGDELLPDSGSHGDWLPSRVTAVGVGER